MKNDIITKKINIIYNFDLLETINFENYEYMDIIAN